MMDIRDCPYCHRSDFVLVAGTHPPAGICPHCGLYRLQVRRTGNEAQRVADITVNDAAYPDPPGTAAHSFEIALLRRWCPELFPGAKALDVGCGLGGFVEALSSAGLQTTGLEPSAAAEAAAGRGRPIRRGSFDRQSLCEEIKRTKYDLISFRESLYYIPDLEIGRAHV